MSRFAPPILAPILAAALLSGCAAPARPTRPVVHVGSAGASASLVLYPLETSSILGHLEPGPELGRLDDDLAVRPSEPLLATSQWPQEARPSITEWRRIHVRDHDGTLIFFLPERAPEPWIPPW